MPIAEIPFQTPGNHLVVFEATLAGRDNVRCILDTGCGVELISEGLQAQLNFPIKGEAETVRTRGEFISLPAAQAPSITLGGHLLRKEWPMGVTNLLDGFLRDFGRIDALLSMKAFEAQPFTLDFRDMVLTLESENSLKERAQSGLITSVTLKKPMPDALTAFVEVDLMGTHQGLFALDTAVGITIMNLKSLGEFGLSVDSPDVRRVQGWAENGESQPRYYSKLSGQIALNDLASEEDPTVCFQKLGHDGVLGLNFLKDKSITFDIPRKRLIFS